jgi:trimeric autotransporter adhesin
MFNLTVSVDPTGLTAGSYVGAILIAGTGQTNGTISTSVSFTLSAPQPVVTLVTNAASFLTGPVSPGEMIAVFGSAANPIGPATAVALNGVTCPSPCKNVPTSMAGVQVIFNPGGIAAPLVYVSGTQVNCIVPYEVLGASSLQVQVNYLGQKSNLQSLQYAPTQPAVFTALGTGTGLATAQQYDAQGVYQGQNSSSNPAKAGWYLTIYATGEGIIPSPAVTGLVTAGPNFVPLLGPPSVLIDGLPATVTYFAEAAGFVSGMMQVNTIVPAAIRSGQAVPLSLTMNGAISQPGVVIYTK